jgi:hypothetical protein
VKWTWTVSTFFYQWELLHCHGQGPSALCVKWPLDMDVTSPPTSF